MAKIVIKKKIFLSFLGDEYKEDYFEFTSVPVKEFSEVSEVLQKNKEDAKGIVETLSNILKSHFSSGSFQGEELAPENIDDLDLKSLTQLFIDLTGQVDELDPKGGK